MYQITKKMKKIKMENIHQTMRMHNQDILQSMQLVLKNSYLNKNSKDQLVKLVLNIHQQYNKNVFKMLLWVTIYYAKQNQVWEKLLFLY